MMCRLSEICDRVREKVDVSSLTVDSYISTENMLPNRGGIIQSSCLPPTGKVSAFREGDVLVSNIRPYFKKIWYAKYHGGCSNDVLVFRAKEGIYPRFLFYLLAGDAFFAYSMATSKGTKMPRGDISAIMEYEARLFPFAIQEKIVAILGALDDKLELNLGINRNLEEQAKAIYKSWFIDYEPFGGQRPSDWLITTLGEVCDCVLGGTPSRKRSEYWGGTVPWINSGKVNEDRIIRPSEYITALGLAKSATKLLPAKTTVLAITGATLGQVSLLEIDSCANQSVVGIRPNSALPYEFIFPFIKHNVTELMTHQTGGAQQHINKQNVEGLPLFVPDGVSMSKYLASVADLYAAIANYYFENSRLEELRDTLLPRLMSGELDVSELNI